MTDPGTLHRLAVDLSDRLIAARVNDPLAGWSQIGGAVGRAALRGGWVLQEYMALVTLAEKVAAKPMAATGVRAHRPTPEGRIDHAVRSEVRIGVAEMFALIGGFARALAMHVEGRGEELPDPPHRPIGFSVQ